MTEAWKNWEGQIVDGHVLRAYLGGSDHSGVFLTDHGHPEPHEAAIKLIVADPANAEFQLSQWEIAANLAHPHLIRIFQSGRCRLDHTSLLYAVMERADEDLSQIIPSRALTPTEASDMLGPVLDALAFLHGKGFVHGHLKPANIMAVGDQLNISSDGISAVGALKGGRNKPCVYDAPEAATRGKSPAGDVWSLGVTLVECVTQQLPSWEWKGQDEPKLSANIPAPFGDIVRHCLRQDPQARWKIADIRARLQPESQAPKTPSTVTPRAQVQRAPEKRRYLLAAAAIIVAALLAIWLGPKLMNQGSHAQPSSPVASEPAPVEASAKPAQPAPVEAPAVEKATGRQPEENASAAPTAPAVSTEPAPLAAVTPKPAAAKVAAGVVGGEAVHQVMPDVPDKARETIQGTVRVSVKVQVDSSGNVTDASVDSPGPSKYFANLALGAARGWKFTPASAGGDNASGEWILRFQFTQDGAKATAVRAAR